MTIFVDTSALYAHLDQDDAHHDEAEHLWPVLLREHKLLTTNYVLLEAHALVQNRLGLEAARALMEWAKPLASVVWVDESLEQAAVEFLDAANQRRLSLVDCVSFVTMRRHNIHHAFSFDGHFSMRGYALPGLPHQ